MNNPDESVCLDPDVEVDGSCDRDVVRPVDAGVVQQMVLDVDDTDELFCLNVDVKYVKLADVRQMDDLDESIDFDYDVKIDG